MLGAVRKQIKMAETKPNKSGAVHQEEPSDMYLSLLGNLSLWGVIANVSSFGKNGRVEAGRCFVRTSLCKYVPLLPRMYIFIVAANKNIEKEMLILRSPQDMRIIQIDITNACPHSCSNCTRFCGHHKKTFFMSFEQFKEAVDSLKDFPNMVGIIGGEPTLHPEFEKFALYLRNSRVGDKNIPVMRDPIPSMQDFIPLHLHLGGNKIGLWTSLYKNYYKHFETINDTFQTQLLNDHDNTCLHQALLMPRKDLNISDEEWIRKRDACWVQNTWSATVTPKGAFFCEVAGALDMLFDGPGGWKVEPGWWKRTPAEFEDQLHWCEMCSGCLDVPQRISNDERDDVTPQMYERLKAIGSPKIKQGKIVVHDLKTFDKSKYHTFTGTSDYIIAAGGVRTSSKNRDYYPRDFWQIPPSALQPFLASNQAKDWILLSETREAGKLARDYFSNVVINPGCVYMTDNDVVAFNVNAKSLSWLFDGSVDIEEIELANIWNYYPIDKIVKVNLGEAIYEKLRADLLANVKHLSNIAIVGADVWSKKLFLKLMEEGLYNVCAWMDLGDVKCYPVIRADAKLLKEVDYVIVACKFKSDAERARMALLRMGVPFKNILEFSMKRNC